MELYVGFQNQLDHKTLDQLDPDAKCKKGTFFKSFL